MTDKQECYIFIGSLIGLEVADNTCFFDEVGLDGFDAEFFMMQLRDRYNINLNGYQPYDFHAKDTDIANPFSALYNLLTGKRRKLMTFTALHLYDVVCAGKWFNPLIEGGG